VLLYGICGLRGFEQNIDFAAVMSGCRSNAAQG